MLVVNNKRYTKKHVIGGAGIFDTIISFGKKLLTSNAAKQAATALAASAAKQARKHIVDRMMRPSPLPDIQPTYQVTPQAAPIYQQQAAPPPVAAPKLSQKARDDLTNLIHQAAPANVDHLMATSGSAIKIQDLVKRKGRRRGSGMKIAN